MNQTAQPAVMPITPLAPQMPLASAPAQPQADVISPAEAKFWQEWAEKAPVLLRTAGVSVVNDVHKDMAFYKIGGIALGAALGGASFTNYIQGKWKWAARGAAALALGASLLLDVSQGFSGFNEASMRNFADALEKDPNLRNQLAISLSANITAEHIQEMGIEKAVLQTVLGFAANVFPHMRQETCNRLPSSSANFGQGRS